MPLNKLKSERTVFCKQNMQQKTTYHSLLNGCACTQLVIFRVAFPKENCFLSNTHDKYCTKEVSSTYSTQPYSVENSLRIHLKLGLRLVSMLNFMQQQQLQLVHLLLLVPGSGISHIAKSRLVCSVTISLSSTYLHNSSSTDLDNYCHPLITMHCKNIK